MNPRFKFKELLKILEDPTNKTKWLVAKFIATKIKQDFDEHLVSTDPGVVAVPNFTVDQFAVFVKQIISDCQDSIHWTCVYTPREWIDKFCEKDFGKKWLKKRGITHQIPESVFKKQRREIDQLYAFLASHHIRKKNKHRIVNLYEDKWDKFVQTPNWEGYFDVFCEINDPNNEYLEFLIIDEKKLPGFLKIKTDDFAMYDEKVIIIYRPNDPNDDAKKDQKGKRNGEEEEKQEGEKGGEEEEKKGTLYLRYGSERGTRFPSVDAYCSFFKRLDEKGILMTRGEMKKELQEMRIKWEKKQKNSKASSS